MKRVNVLMVGCVLALAGAAFGARATPSFDALEAGVVELQNSIRSPRDAKTRRASRVYVSVIIKLSRDTRSLRQELSRGRRILRKLDRLDDPAVDALVSGAVAALADEIYDVLDEAQLRLESSLSKASRDKAQRQIDIARNLTVRGSAAVKLKTQLGHLIRAEARARRALALAGTVSGDAR